MKQLLINKENPKGVILEVEEREEKVLEEIDPIKAFFEGLASADTNSIAKIRALAREFLNVEGE